MEGGGAPKASQTKSPTLEVLREMDWGLEHGPWRNLVMVGEAGGRRGRSELEGEGLAVDN